MKLFINESMKAVEFGFGMIETYLALIRVADSEGVALCLFAKYNLSLSFNFGNIYSILFYFGMSVRRSSRSAFRQPTGNEVSDH